MKPSRASASAVAMMKMSRFGDDERGREREARRGDDAEARREPVHVVEQVERVRQPDEPEHPDRPAERRAVDELDRDRALEHDDRGHELGAELRGRMQVDDVVEQAEAEDDRAARERPRASRPGCRPGRSPVAARTASAKPAKMPIPPNAGVGLVCQRSGRGSAPKACSARGQRSSPAMTKNAIGAAASAASAFTAGGLRARVASTAEA